MMMMMMKSTTTIAVFVVTLFACIAGGEKDDETVTIFEGKKKVCTVRKYQESGFALIDCLSKKYQAPPSGANGDGPGKQRDDGSKSSSDEKKDDAAAGYSPEYKDWLDKMGLAGAKVIDSYELSVMKKVCSKDKAQDDDNSVVDRAIGAAKDVLTSKEEKKEKKEKKRLLPIRTVMDTVCPVVPYIQRHFVHEYLVKNLRLAEKAMKGSRKRGIVQKITGWFKTKPAAAAAKPPAAVGEPQHVD